MSEYFDREGKPMTMDEWCIRFEDNDYKRVAKSTVGDAEVSTVWLGLNHRWNAGPPMIFETMIFGGEYDESQWRYSTEEQARKAHAAIVAALEVGEDPDRTEVHPKQTPSPKEASRE